MVVLVLGLVVLEVVVVGHGLWRVVWSLLALAFGLRVCVCVMMPWISTLTIHALVLGTRHDEQE